MSELRETCVVIGSEGMLGTDLVTVLNKSGTEVIGLDIDDIDITQPESVHQVLDGYRPGLIINVAALTDVDGCETRQEEAFGVNAHGPAHLAEFAAETRAFFLHLSTDYVFDGMGKVPYKEFDKTNPIGVYGKSKAKGEALVRELLPDQHCIVRTQWLYGLHGKNFVETILNAAQSREVLRVVDDQYGSPTYTRDLAGALVTLCGTRVCGTIHVTNSGETTWYAFASEIIKLKGVPGVRVEPIRSEELSRPAPRPAYSVLDNSRYAGLTGTRLRDWKDALKEYLEQKD